MPQIALVPVACHANLFFFLSQLFGSLEVMATTADWLIEEMPSSSFVNLYAM